MIIHPQKLLVGLTGGIACGKSTALGILRKLGWKIISTDEIVADLLQNDYSFKKAIQTKWGSVVFENDEIDKKKIAQIIFNDQEAKLGLRICFILWLERIGKDR